MMKDICTFFTKIYQTQKLNQNDNIMMLNLKNVQVHQLFNKLFQNQAFNFSKFKNSSKNKNLLKLKSQYFVHFQELSAS